MKPIIRDLVTFIAWLAFVAMATLLVCTITIRPSHSSPPGISLTRHSVVISSSLQSCTAEDGGAILPCTWNVNPGDGNGQGLSFYYGKRGYIHYVWIADPTIATRWTWVPLFARHDLDIQASCVWKMVTESTWTVRCPNGTVERVRY